MGGHLQGYGRILHGIQLEGIGTCCTFNSTNIHLQLLVSVSVSNFQVLGLGRLVLGLWTERSRSWSRVYWSRSRLVGSRLQHWWSEEGWPDMCSIQPSLNQFLWTFCVNTAFLLVMSVQVSRFHSFIHSFIIYFPHQNKYYNKKHTKYTANVM